MYDFPCVLFAGGKSSRMGEDKVLLPFGEHTTLTAFLYEKLSNIFSKVYISTKDPSKFCFDADFIIDRSEVYAPTAGFVSVFRQLKEERFFVLGVDMPFVDAWVIEKLIQADHPSYDATVAYTQNGIESLCGIYHASLQERFEAMLRGGNHKLRKLLEEVRTKRVEFEDATKFFNLNKPQEYQKAKQLYDIIKS